MSKLQWRIMLSSGESQLIDVSGIADDLLSKLCEETGLHPMAVLLAALVLLKQRNG